MNSSLKPVPTLHKKLVFDKSLSRVSKACFVRQAKLPAFPVDVVREGGALVVVETDETVPFVVSEVPSSRHNVPLPVELINDSTLLLFEGVEQPIMEWALDYGITPGIIIGRLGRGMSISDAITTPMLTGHAGQRLPIYSWKQVECVNRRRGLAKTYSFEGRTLSVPEWSRLTGLKMSTIGYRLRAGWPIGLAVTTPLDSRGRTPGVVSNLPAFSRTGGGSTAQESSEITFSEKAENA